MIKASSSFPFMKFHPLVATCAGLGLLGTVVLAKDPVLNTPGTANWFNQSTNTGTRTVFTLTGNTVLSWDQLNLKKGSEMEFNFVSGNTVVNFLGGTGTHTIDGAVTSNGIVAFFSPNADLQVSGSIIAKGVTLATMNADADDFSDGDGFELFGTGDARRLTIGGTVEATDGDVVLGGEKVSIRGSALVQASQDVLVGGSRNFTVSPDGDRRINEKSGEGFVLNLGRARAARIEVVAGKESYNQGTYDAGEGRVFLRVGVDGQIVEEKTGVIIGDEEFEGTVVEGPNTDLDEGDTAAPISEGTLTFPALSRPDGTKVPTTTPKAAPNGGGNSGSGGASGRPSSGPGSESLAARTISYSVPMSASADAGRDAPATERARRQVARVDSSKSMLQRSSFFGMRGGTSKATASR